MEKVERQEAEKLQFLRNAWQEGIDSGDAGAVDFGELKKEARATCRLEGVSAWARFATRTAPAQTCSISGFTSRAKISPPPTKFMTASKRSAGCFGIIRSSAPRAPRSPKARGRSSSNAGLRFTGWRKAECRWFGSSMGHAISQRSNGRRNRSVRHSPERRRSP